MGDAANRYLFARRDVLSVLDAPPAVFSAGTTTEVLEQIKHRVPPPPRTIDDKIPKALEEICMKAMAKSPADRYRTAGDMAADLPQRLPGAAIKPRAVEGRCRCRRGRCYSAGGVGALARS